MQQKIIKIKFYYGERERDGWNTVNYMKKKNCFV